MVINLARVEQVFDRLRIRLRGAERRQDQRKFLMAQFITGEPEQLVFDEGTAQSKATLGAVKGSTRAAGDVTASPEVRASVIRNQSGCGTEQSEIVKGIGSREVAAADVGGAIGLDPVGAGLGYHIQHPAGPLTILAVVVLWQGGGESCRGGFSERGRGWDLTRLSRSGDGQFDPQVSRIAKVQRDALGLTNRKLGCLDLNIVSPWGEVGDCVIAAGGGIRGMPYASGNVGCRNLGIGNHRPLRVHDLAGDRRASCPLRIDLNAPQATQNQTTQT